ncbi:MAG: NAD(P)/FAD-dependent oxidoreductase [Candidatus Rokuibacteriota bacterium]
MYDAIIVGARCAGASTAMLLARKGHRVLLVERAKLPSDIPHGHFIHRGGPARLARWGLLDRILGTGCPAVEAQVLDLAGFPLVGRNLAVDGVPFGCGPRRKVLDKVLVDAAVEAGADFRDQFTVSDVLAEDGRVVGIAGRRTCGRSEVTERARLVIGADGRNSRLARIVGAATYQAVPALTCWYFSYWSGNFERALALHAPGRKVVLAFPSNDGLHAIFIAWPIDEFGAVRKDIEGRFTEVLQRVPDLAGRIEAGRREERFYGTADLPNFYRVSSGPGWALVGDAAATRTPISPSGSPMPFATRSSSLTRPTRGCRESDAWRRRWRHISNAGTPPRRPTMTRTSRRRGAGLRPRT